MLITNEKNNTWYCRIRIQYLSINNEACNNQIENNIVLIHGGILADANIPLVTFSDILTKSYNIYYITTEGEW